MKKTIISTILFCLFIFLNKISYGQLLINNNVTPSQLVHNIVGTSIITSNIISSGTGANLCIGQFSNGNSTNLGLNSGIVLSTGNIFDIPNIVSSFASTDNGGGTDSLLSSIISDTTLYNATILEFDFIPSLSQFSFRYVFGSEEYPEFVNSGYNDVFGFFISGPNPSGGNYINKNIAIIPGTFLPVSINNINDSSNASYFINNEALNGSTIVYDGFTVPLTASCQVIPCQQYHIKLAIGDAGDAIYDSGIFIETGNFAGYSISSTTTNPTLSNHAIENCNDALITFYSTVSDSFPTTINYIIGGSATNGVDYTTIPSSITIPAGDSLTTLTIHPLYDNLIESAEIIQLYISSPPCGYDTITIYLDDYHSLLANTSNDTTICIGDQLSLAVNINNGKPPYTYLWSDGSTNSTTSVLPTESDTTYIYHVAVLDACIQQINDSIVVSVNSIPTTPIITQNGDTLISSAITGNQWYFNNNLISGAINQTYIPPYNGNYYVIVTMNSCSSDTSNIIQPTDVVEINNNSNWLIYPSPVTNNLIIETNNNNLEQRIEIIDLMGQIIYSSTIRNKIIVDMSHLVNSIYFVKFYSDKSIIMKKIVKQ